MTIVETFAQEMLDLKRKYGICEKEGCTYKAVRGKNKCWYHEEKQP